MRHLFFAAKVPHASGTGSHTSDQTAEKGSWDRSLLWENDLQSGQECGPRPACLQPSGLKKPWKPKRYENREQFGGFGTRLAW